MAIKQIFKVSRKTFFNPSAWLGYEMLSNNTRTIWNILKGLFTPAEPVRTESFEEAMKRQNTSETDLVTVKRQYLFYTFVFIGLGVLALVASFYLLIHHATVAGWMLALGTSALFFVYAFRYHFWYFQIKHRKLGCTFEEWWQGKPYENKETK